MNYNEQECLCKHKTTGKFTLSIISHAISLLATQISMTEIINNKKEEDADNDTHGK